VNRSREREWVRARGAKVPVVCHNEKDTKLRSRKLKDLEDRDVADDPFVNLPIPLYTQCIPRVPCVASLEGASGPESCQSSSCVY
jgi:hypothetical protein